jgi:alkylation response protein AidB-like acyl-CoA dehydrogenase
MLDERWGDAAEALREGLRTLLERECPPAVVRAAEATPDGRAAALDARLDAFGLGTLPPDPAVLTVVAWELGRVLAPVPFVEAAPVAAVLGAEHAGVVSALDGPVPPSAAGAVVADAEDRVVLVGVDVARARRTTAGDVLAPVAAGSGAAVIGDAEQTDRVRRLTRLLAAARVAGATEALLALGVDYVGRREQFGRPIGAFQAVAHRLADAAIASDGLGLLVRKCAWVAEEAQGGDGAPSDAFAAMAWSEAVVTGRRVATEVHQCMGGYGFATEYDCELASRRIRSWSMRLGDPRRALADVARLLLDSERRGQVQHLWNHDTGVPVPRWVDDLDV